MRETPPRSHRSQSEPPYLNGIGRGYVATPLSSNQILGLVGLFNTLQPVIDVLLVIQSIGFVAAAIMLMVGASKPSPVP